MLLPALVALLVAAGPLARGAADPGVQCLFHGLVTLGLGLWLLTRIALGFVPLPSNRALVWTGLLFALGAASVWASPVAGLCRPSWFVFLEGLWLFPAMAALSKDERVRVDQAVRVAAWLLMALAFYQRLSARIARPAAAFEDPSAYAGAVLMFLPLALERGDRLLGLGLVWSLWWTRDLGAWLGLSAALAITQRRTHPGWSRAGAAVALACGVILYGRLDSAEALHRWGWWRAAWAMAAARPLVGFGPGSFGSVLAALCPWSAPAPHARQYFLETAAGFGAPFALLWFGGLWRSVAGGGPFKRFAVIAVAVQSLWESTLSVPALFWLFCYCAASTIPDSPRGVNLPSPYRPAAAALAAGVALLFGANVWALQRGRAAAVRGTELAAAGRLEEARSCLEEARRLDSADPARALAEADVEVRRARLRGDRDAWLYAAAALEEAAAADPYRSATWTALEQVYRRMGRPALAALAQQRFAQAAAL